MDPRRANERREPNGRSDEERKGVFILNRCAFDEEASSSRTVCDRNRVCWRSRAEARVPSLRRRFCWETHLAVITIYLLDHPFLFAILGPSRCLSFRKEVQTKRDNTSGKKVSRKAN